MSKDKEGARNETGLPFESLEFVDELYHAEGAKWDKAFNDQGGADYRGQVIVSGAALKAAIEAGVIVSPDTEVLRDKRGKARHFIGGLDVDKLTAAQVITLGVMCLRWYRGITGIDGPN